MKTRAATISRRLGRAFLARHPAEASRVLETLPPAEVARILAREPHARVASLLERMSPPAACATIAALDSELVASVVPMMDPQRAAIALLPLDDDRREQVLGVLPTGAAAELRDIMTYPAGSAGSLMNARLPMRFRSDQTVRDVVAQLRQIRRRRVNQIYLVDDEGRLLAVVPLQEVILARATDRLDSLKGVAMTGIPAIATRDEVVERFRRSVLTSLPVVDVERRLLGAIPHAAVVEAASEAAISDIQAMVGAGREERALSSPLVAVRKRLPWLQINLLTAFLAASVVGVFEDTIARVTALAVLLPVVAGQSGNTGAQALAVTLRGLALREVRVRQWLRIVAKESSAGALNGVAVALTTCLGVFLWSGSLGLCMVIGLAMVLSMVIAGMAGAAIPMLLTSLGQDPAQSSSIILTTVTDVFGFFSFLGLATVFASML